MNLDDAQFVGDHLFKGLGLPCEDAADFDDDGEVTLSDFTSINNFVLHGIGAPVGPFIF